MNNVPGNFIPDSFCPGSSDTVVTIEPAFDSRHTETMIHLSDSLKKQIPDAVFQKLESMDETARHAFVEEFSRKKKSPALAFWLLLPFGMHYAYAGRVWLTLIFLITFGGFGIWWFIDLFRVWGMVRERNRSIAIQVLRDIQVLN